MSDIKLLGKNSDFRVVKMEHPGGMSSIYSLSAYAIQNVDHVTPGKHYTRRHYQVRLYADPIVYTGLSNGAYDYMSTLTLHQSGSTDTHVLQQQTADSAGHDTLMLDWTGTIGQGDSLSMVVKRINGSSINTDVVFYIMIA